LNTKGLSQTNLKIYRQFYIAYPLVGEIASSLLDGEISQTVSDQFKTISQTVSDKSTNYNIPVDKLISHLSFSHFVELIKISDTLRRTYYEIEIIKGVWSVRELKRQINSLSYERSAASKNPKLIVPKLSLSNETLTPEQLIKTPYVFDFLGLPDDVLGSESQLEQALINELKSFILELGHGFCFEAQQKRIVIGGEYFFIDLVFYHRILKCHIIIELKIDEFNHTNAGQLNTYIQYYKTNEQREDDNPPIGILLCTNKNEELVQYALGGMDENLFVSQYKTVLPSTAELKNFLQEEKKKL
jgi:predicted nuclease of restriction endonuclease-like (RecB) superfamily